MIPIELMPPLMFGGLVVFMLIGFPVAFSLAATGLGFGYLGIQLGLLGPELLQALPERVFGIMRNDTLLAIPFFTFMGLILERSGMAEDPPRRGDTGTRGRCDGARGAPRAPNAARFDEPEEDANGWRGAGSLG